ncbi:MAG: lipopolysaccharide biosynthesis protein [Bacteroidia bacterium]
MLGGLLWTSIEKFGGRVLTLLIFFLLARLLEPADFGLVAIVNSVVGLAYIFIEMGFTAALVQKEQLDDTDKDSSFWGSMGLGALIFLAVFAAAPLVAAFYEEPQLTDLIRVIAITLLMSSLGNTHRGLYQRNMAFRLIAVRQIAATIVGGAVGIALALTGYGVWGLVMYLLVRSVVETALLFFWSDWQPRFSFSMARYQELLRFGLNVLGSRLLFYGNGDLINMLIGHFLGLEALGLFSVASKVYFTFKDLMINTISNVTVPIFSKLQSKPDELRAVFQDVIEKVSFVTFPVCMVLVGMSDDFIRIVFGEKWLPASPIMQLLVMMSIFSLITSYANDLLLALGKVFLSFKINLLSTVLSLIIFFATVPFGILAVAAGFLVRDAIMAPICMAAIPCSVGLAYRQITRSLLLAALVAVLSGGAVYLISLVQSGNIWLWIGLKALVATGVFAFGIAVFAPAISLVIRQQTARFLSAFQKAG